VFFAAEMRYRTWKALKGCVIAAAGTTAPEREETQGQIPCTRMCIYIKIYTSSVVLEREEKISLANVKHDAWRN